MDRAAPASRNARNLAGGRTLSRAGLGAGLIAAGYAEPSLMFLAGTHIALLPNGSSAAGTPGKAVIVTGEDLGAFTREAARRHRVFRPLAHIAGYNYSRGQWTELDVLAQENASGPAAPMP